MNHLCALILALFVFWPTLAQADLGQVKQAYQAKDWPKAHALLKPLIAQNNPDAHFYLANLYLEGYGAPQNFPLAHTHYQEAAKGYNPDAMLALATLYSSGKGVTANKKISLYWFEQAARFGNIPAQFMLGGINFGGDRDFAERDLIKAYKWFSLVSQNTATSSKRMHDVATRMKDMLYKNFTETEKALADEALKSFAPLSRDEAQKQKIVFSPPAP